MTVTHPIETIRISKKGRDQLLNLKRKTKIKNWNVLCRWGFCMSLAEPSPPRPIKIPTDSPVEMTWRTFGGVHDEAYLALLKARCMRDGLELSDKTLATQLRLHIHRGIGYLAGRRSLRTISDLVGLATRKS